MLDTPPVCKVLPPSSALGGERLLRFLSSKPVEPFGLGHLTQTSVMSSNVSPTHRPSPSQPTTPYTFLPPPAQPSYTLLHPASLAGRSLVCLCSVVLCLWAFFKVVSQGHEVSVIAPCRRTPLISWGWGGVGKGGDRDHPDYELVCFSISCRRLGQRGCVEARAACCVGMWQAHSKHL